MAISTVSYTKTPQAKADTFALTESNFENADSSFLLDVMANDLGGNGKSLYSLDDGNNVLKDLLVQDTGGWESTLLGNKIRIVNGKVEFQLGQDANALNAHEQVTDTFYYAIQMGNGTLSFTTASLTIQGENDAASMAGDSTGSVTEDGVQVASGTLTVIDVDHGEAHTATDSGTTGNGAYSVDADGHWSFTVDNAAIQHLGAGKSVVDTFTVKSLDGTAEQEVSITIHGVNDAADITGDDEGDVAEDGQLTASGKLSVSDIDDGESGFLAASEDELTGVYGNFSFDNATGEWTYTLDNDKAQSLTSAQGATETLTIRSIDGTEKVVTVNIAGADEQTTPVTPTDTPPEPQGAAAGKKNPINYGQNFVNGVYVIPDAAATLENGETYMLTGQISYVSSHYGDYLGDTVTDTYIEVKVKIGQDTHNATIILVGVDQFDPATQLS